MSKVQSLDIDLFDDAVLADPHPTYKKIRDTGDAVWIPKINMYAIAGYQDAKKALSASDTLISGQGVLVNSMMLDENHPPVASTLSTDGDVHKQFKQAVVKPLSPRAVLELKDRLNEEAVYIVDKLINGEEFDGTTTLAAHIPYQVIVDMVGLEGVDTQRILAWATAATNAFGPIDKARTVEAMPVVQDFIRFTSQLKHSDYKKGGWADKLYDAANHGEIPEQAAKDLVLDYILPSLDTTIYSTAELLYQLATVPNVLDTLKNDPSLISSAIYEAVRLATPARGFTRFVKEDFHLRDTRLPAGSRVFILYASANRDERHYPDPHTFDVYRNPRDQLGWGYGAHHCAGSHLARAEIEALLRVIVDKVERIEVGAPSRLVNNVAQGFSHLPMKLVAKQ